MAAISGKQMRMGITIATTWGTEVEVDKLLPFDSWDPGKSVTILDGVSPNGLGRSMASDEQRGAEDIRPVITTKMGDEHGWEYLLAQFMGTSGAPSEQTASQSDYLHRITFNETLNAKLASVAVKDSSGTVTSYPSFATTKVTIDISGGLPTVPVITFEGLADKEENDSTTNTTSVLNALSAPTIRPTVVEQADEFLVNAQSGGALSNSTDLVSITAARIELERPQSSPSEIKGSADNSQPVDDGLFVVTMGLTFAKMDDHTWIDYANNETALKCSLTVEGAQLGTGENRSFAFYMPRCKVLDEPSRAVTSPGFNPFDVVLRAYVASANPTGMNSTYPYFELINTISTSLLA